MQQMTDDLKTFQQEKRREKSENRIILPLGETDLRRLAVPEIEGALFTNSLCNNVGLMISMLHT